MGVEEKVDWGTRAVITVVVVVAVASIISLVYFKSSRYDDISDLQENEVLVKGMFIQMDNVIEDLGGPHVISELTPFGVWIGGAIGSPVFTGAVLCKGLEGPQTAIQDLETGDEIVVSGIRDPDASLDNISGYSLPHPTIPYIIITVEEIHKAEWWE